MADGSRKAITSAQVDDAVLATDPTTKETATKVVTDVRAHKADNVLVTIWVSSTSGDGSLVATDEHPFWVESLQKWVNAEDLKPGYQSLTADNRSATVSRTQSFSDKDRRVYNLMVDGLHTYRVGVASIAVLTHNGDPQSQGSCPTGLPIRGEAGSIDHALEVHRPRAAGPSTGRWPRSTASFRTSP
ncbi:Pretoxin HINT domain-containing protein [Lentzea waywayandensis]|uniref:Pretoxin HINT domain-containing protein n=1 Tax=Lentzea waywayandensis TaxID=84724 RepID=A0A1I6E290_9PSEU|nr:polymorphic toxin-type HINT domain-containing protein [Lentzea waywayandensis]SFR11737.1 Pretoxin HINT domain-containing protein [Lentzea waywayandensis]